MKLRIIFFLVLSILGILLIGLVSPANDAFAAPNLQGFITATPGPDGRIMYIVVEGDN